MIRRRQKKPVPPAKQIKSLAFAVLLALTIRWALFEAYVIPSGSMIPSLLIHDHIFVNKLIYGLRIPWSKKWLYHFKNPERGEVIIFKFPRDESIFYVKRVVGTAGDKVSWDGEQLSVNGVAVERKEGVKPTEKIGEDPEQYFWYRENVMGREYPIMVRKDTLHQKVDDFEVPPDSFFVLGDNRDNSADSRAWGIVPMENVLGRAGIVWLSCEEPIPIIRMFCNPLTIRWGRFFHGVQ